MIRIVAKSVMQKDKIPEVLKIMSKRNTSRPCFLK
jgi:hypothetical protein